MYDVLHYVTVEGTDIFADWMEKLRDAKAMARIAARIERLEAGLFGDCKSLKAGVRELRIHHGPGYRVYFAQDGKKVILLLCAGDKRKQADDIKRAVKYWLDYQDRKE